MAAPLLLSAWGNLFILLVAFTLPPLIVTKPSPPAPPPMAAPHLADPLVDAVTVPPLITTVPFFWFAPPMAAQTPPVAVILPPLMVMVLSLLRAMSPLSLVAVRLPEPPDWA